LLPITLALSVLLWVVATSGGHHVFVKEVLGEAYDSQAEHLLRGDVEVDVDAIRPEAMIVDGKVCMYFGPFPAFLRMPLNLVYPAGRGMWSRISGFGAGVIALFAFAGLVAEALRSSPISKRSRAWIGNVCVVGFALASPLLFLLGSLSIYNEAIVWGLAASLAALFFAYRCCSGDAPERTRWLVGFSFCAGAALLSRVTFGAPLLLIAAMLAWRLLRERRIARFSALLLPLGAALVFHLLFSYVKFGTFSGVNLDHYINPVHREFARAHGMLNLNRIPFGMADYFGWRLPAAQATPPFLIADRHPILHGSSYYSLPFSETYLPVTWCSSWLVLGALFGVVHLFQKKRSDMFERATALGLILQFVCILSYFALAQRYSADLYPFLIFCFVIFLRAGPRPWQRTAVIGLVLLSVIVNTFATASWLARDGNLPAETRTFWNTVGGNRPPGGS
jgi:hypothetical protein